MRQSFPSLAIQSVAHGPTASASPGSLSKTQNLRAPCSRPMESESDTYWTRPPRSVCVTMKVLGARLQHSGAMAFPSFTSANREALSSHLRVLERSSGVFLCVYMRERQTETEVDRERAWDEHTWAWSFSASLRNYHKWSGPPPWAKLSGTWVGEGRVPWGSAGRRGEQGACGERAIAFSRKRRVMVCFKQLHMVIPKVTESLGRGCWLVNYLQTWWLAATRGK